MLMDRKGFQSSSNGNGLKHVSNKISQIKYTCTMKLVNIFHGEGNGNPHQYSYLENPMVRGAWQATVYGVVSIGHDLATKLLRLLNIFQN